MRSLTAMVIQYVSNTKAESTDNSAALQRVDRFIK